MSTNIRSGDRNLSASLRSYIPVRDGVNGDEPLGDAVDVEKHSDEELMRLISLRSVKVLEALYDRYSRAVYSLPYACFEIHWPRKRFPRTRFSAFGEGRPAIIRREARLAPGSLASAAIG